MSAIAESTVSRAMRSSNSPTIIGSSSLPSRSISAARLGINPQIEIDYLALPLERGDVFLLATDGVYEHVSARFIVGAINDNSADLDKAARIIVDEAFQHGSPDNLTIQIVRIDDIARRRSRRGFRSIHRIAGASAAGGKDAVRRL